MAAIVACCCCSMLMSESFWIGVADAFVLLAAGVPVGVESVDESAPATAAIFWIAVCCASCWGLLCDSGSSACVENSPPSRVAAMVRLPSPLPVLLFILLLRSAQVESAR